MLILSGRVSIKMAPVIRRIYDQMLEPKWVIAMGACASSAGVFNNYALVAGADKFLPVDVHVPGLPAAARGADPRHPQAAAQDPGPPRPRAGASATRRRARRSCRTRTSPLAPHRAGRGQWPLDAGRHRTRADRPRAARPLPGLDRRTRSTTAASRRWSWSPSAVARRPRLAARRARPGVRLPGQPARLRLPARRAALRRPLRAAQHGARRAHAREGAARRPGRAGAAGDRLLRRAVPDRRVPGARGVRHVRDRASAAIRTCAGS